MLREMNLFPNVCWIFTILCFVATFTDAEGNISLRINEGFKCEHKELYIFKGGDIVTVSVYSPVFINHAQFLVFDGFLSSVKYSYAQEKFHYDDGIHIGSFEPVTALKHFRGRWIFHFLILKNVQRDNDHSSCEFQGNNYTRVGCAVDVTIVNNKNDTKTLDIILLDNRCDVNKSQIWVHEGDTLLVRVSVAFEPNKDFICTSNKNDNITFMEKDNLNQHQLQIKFWRGENTINATKSLEGNWTCIIDNFQNQLNCSFEIIVESLALAAEPKKEATNVLYIAIGAGVIVALIIIAQSVAVCYFKAKANAIKGPTRLENLSQRNNIQHEERVYSTTPSAKSLNKIKNQENSRVESEIYESIEEVLERAERNNANRPPVPTPDELYEDPEISSPMLAVPAPKNVGALVAPAALPALPTTDTIPRNRKNTLQLPMSAISNLPPKKPVQTPVQLTPIAEKRHANNSPHFPTKSPVANELESIMKKKQAGLSIMGNVNQAQKPSLSSKKNVLPPPKPDKNKKGTKPLPETVGPQKKSNVSLDTMSSSPKPKEDTLPPLPPPSKPPKPAPAPSTRLPPKPAAKAKPLPPLPASESQEEIYNPKWDDEEFETYDDVSKFNLYNL